MSGVLDKIGGNIKKKIEENKKEQIKEYKISAQNEVIIIENEKFDYTEIEFEVAEYLKKKEHDIKNIFSKAYTEIGEILFEAQEKLSNHNGGIFENWYESLGFKKDKVYRLIARYKLVLANCENKKIVENLPLSLSYEIAKDSCSEELRQKVLNGEIKTLKEFNEEKSNENDKVIENIIVDEVKLKEKIFDFEKKYEELRKNLLKDNSELINEKRIIIYNEIKKIEKRMEELIKNF